MRREGRLGDRTQAEALRGEQKCLNVEATVHGTVRAQFRSGRDDCDVRCVEESEVPRGLLRRCCSVASGHSDTVVKLHRTLTSSLLVDARVALGGVEMRA